MASSIAFSTDKIIPAWLQPTVVLDLLAAREIDIYRILSDSALLPMESLFMGRFINAKNFDRLLLNAERQWPDSDFAFQLGHHLYKKGTGPLPDVLEGVTDRAVFLELIIQFQRLVGPTLNHHLITLDQKRQFCLLHPSASTKVVPVILHAAMTLLAHLIKQHCPNVTVHYFFTESSDKVEQFHTHLGTNCHFSTPFNGILLISEEALSKATVHSDGLLRRVAYERCQSLAGEHEYFIPALIKLLQPEKGSPPDLQGCAEKFGLSPSTFKRRLSEHKLSFQTVLDKIRVDYALAEFLLADASVEAVSELLHFHDTSNFRRAFKRWTGTTPALLKETHTTVMQKIN